MSKTTESYVLREYAFSILSAISLLIGIYLEFWSNLQINEFILIGVYLIAYSFVGLPLVWWSLKLILRLDKAKGKSINKYKSIKI